MMNMRKQKSHMSVKLVVFFLIQLFKKLWLSYEFDWNSFNAPKATSVILRVLSVFWAIAGLLWGQGSHSSYTSFVKVRGSSRHHFKLS